MADPGRRAEPTEVYAQCHDGRAFVGVVGSSATKLVRVTDGGPTPRLELFLQSAHSLLAPTFAGGVLLDHDGSALEEESSPPPSFKKQPLQYRVAAPAVTGPADALANSAFVDAVDAILEARGLKRKAEEALHNPRTEFNIENSHATFYDGLVARGVMIEEEAAELRASTFFDSPDLLLSRPKFLKKAIPKSVAQLNAEPPLQAHNTAQAMKVVAAIRPVTARFWVDTHGQGGGILSGFAPPSAKWHSYPDGTMSCREPASPDSPVHALDAIAFVEYKCGITALTANGDRGQVAAVLISVMKAQPSRSVAFALLANYAYVRLLRISRTVAPPYLCINIGPPEAADDYGLAFNRFLLAPNAALGFSDPIIPAGWERMRVLGCGAGGRVLLFHRTAAPPAVPPTMPPTVPPPIEIVVKCFESPDAATRERDSLAAIIALGPPNDATCAQVCRLHDVDFGPNSLALSPEGTELTTLSRVHARQVAVLLDHIHAHNRLHGDVRLANILQGDGGRALVIDYEFGGESGAVSDVRKRSISFQSDRVLGLIREGATAVAYIAEDERETFAKLLLWLRSDAIREDVDAASNGHKTRVGWARLLLKAWVDERLLVAARAATTCVAIFDLIYGAYE